MLRAAGSTRVQEHRCTITQLQVPLYRLWLAWRFRLLQGHRHRRLVLEHLDSLSLVVLPEVFNPRLFVSSEALVRMLRRTGIGAGARVLDMGTGSGVGAIAAARLGAQVTAVDISPDAVRCTTINALLNRVEADVDVRRGDLFEAVPGERFDLVLFNPPFYAGIPAQPWEYAWRSTDVLQRFAAGLGGVLNPGGRALLVVSSRAVGVAEALARHPIQLRTLWMRSTPGEDLMVLEWTPLTQEEAGE